MNNKYELIKSDGYESNNSLFKCKNCGNYFHYSLHRIQRQSTQKACPFCEVTKKNATKEQAEFKLKQIGEDYTFIDYRSFQDCDLIHNSCGHKLLNANLTRIIMRNTKHCINCSHRSVAYTSSFVKDEIFKLTNGEYKVLSDYKKENEKILIRHELCGNEWLVLRRNFVYRGIRCPKCRKYKYSKVQDKISKFLEENISIYNYDIFREKTFDGCKDKRVLPFDFYIKELNLLIEYDGDQHFHKMRIRNAIDKLNITHKHDLIKNNYCLENNINLLRIPYDISDNDIFIILKQVLEAKIIDSTTIMKFNLYYNGENNEKYYSRFDIDYE